MDLRSHLRTLTIAGVACGVLLTGQAAAGAWADSADPSAPGVASTAIATAPQITRDARPIQTPPTVVRTTPATSAPTVTRNPRPIADPPVVVTPSTTAPSSSGPVLERGTRTVRGVPTFRETPLVVGGCTR